MEREFGLHIGLDTQCPEACISELEERPTSERHCTIDSTDEGSSHAKADVHAVAKRVSDKLAAADADLLSSALSRLGSEAKCSVCLGGFINPSVIGNCNHLFCRDCATKARQTKMECPMCKACRYDTFPCTCRRMSTYRLPCRSAR